MTITLYGQELEAAECKLCHTLHHPPEAVEACLEQHRVRLAEWEKNVIGKLKALRVGNNMDSQNGRYAEKRTPIKKPAGSGRQRPRWSRWDSRHKGGPRPEYGEQG